MKGTRTGIVLGLALGGLLALGIQNVSAHTKRFSSEVSLHQTSADAAQTTTLWHGVAESRREECLFERLVRIYKQEVDGPDDHIDTGVTSGPGSANPYSYRVFVPGYPPPEGTYYAKMLRKVVLKTRRHKHVCATAISNLVVVLN